ncbi:MAG: amidophosphoribosyltransferase [Acidobacteria bacterium]|nr:amidophosphoribosyltransferase [Acidobacteriota bacterium]
MTGALKEKCGVAAVVGHAEAAKVVYLALYALQHRGQEAAGIAAWDGGALRVHSGLGLVAEVFSPEIAESLRGKVAIGHTRYATAGASSPAEAQPLRGMTRHGPLALGHNGNLVNALTLRRELEGAGAVFHSSSDTEVILQLLARSAEQDVADALADALRRVRGAFSLVVLAGDRVIAARDPQGFRPLSLGRLPDGAAVVASETCAFDLIGARFERDIEAGEMVVLGPRPDQLASSFPAGVGLPAPCIFEYVYFSRPDSRVFGRDVADVRRALGRELAREQPAQADLVVPVPDSGVPAAIGYSRESGIPFDHGLTRNHYVGRTFIEPTASIRNFGVKIKLNPVRSLVAGRRLVLVDDSIVRGTTMKKIVQLLRQAGAREVHVRISAPPTVSPCFYGIDTPVEEELIASSNSVEEIRQAIGADSLGYLSVEGMHRAAGAVPGEFCAACFTRRYPVEVVDRDELADARRG